MRKPWIVVLSAACLCMVLAANASAQNSLAVTSDAAMGNMVAGSNCTGDGQPGPCGLEMRYEPASTFRAKVVYGDFGPESVFRERFWMNVSNFDGKLVGRNFYHTISGCYPNNQAGCALQTTYRSDLFRNSVGDYAIGVGATDNQKNRVGVPRCAVPNDAPFEVQFEWTAGCSPTKGIMKLTIFDQSGTELCTKQALVQNCALNVKRLNFETLPEGGVLSASAIFIDEYSSFRSLAP